MLPVLHFNLMLMLVLFIILDFTEGVFSMSII